MDTVEKYIAGLKKAYHDNGIYEPWAHFEKIKHGASKESIKALKDLYPEIPDTLINLLEYVDGTYWRRYKGETVIFYFLGSDVEEYPYYLLSTNQIIKNQNLAPEYYSDYIERLEDDVDVDEKITDKIDKLKWLHFSDCMNNGGTSQLFIDFSPSDKGKIGQVVRFLHDPDELSVIAESFEEYLQNTMQDGFDFIRKDLLA